MIRRYLSKRTGRPLVDLTNIHPIKIRGMVLDGFLLTQNFRGKVKNFDKIRFWDVLMEKFEGKEIYIEIKVGTINE